MKIIEKTTVYGRRDYQSFAFAVNPAARQQTSGELQRRDRADFDREVIAYARTLKSSVKAEPDTSVRVKQGITSNEISDEIERLKSRSALTAQELSGSDKAPSDTASEVKPTDTTTGTEPLTPTAEMLDKQIKQISEFLKDGAQHLSKPIREQLEKVYKLLCEQKETDPDVISKPLRESMDKLSKMIADSNKSDSKKSLSELLEEQKKRFENIFSHTSDKDNSLSSIKYKIRSGRKLTPAEQSYLSSKDPAAYESYQQINSARSMFRCSLNACRTRDDVIGMRLSNALSALASYRKAIRQGGDGADIIGLNAAFENELRDFTKSSSFRSLPTAAECNKFDRDLAKARKFEREKKLEKQRELRRLRNKRFKKKKQVKTPGDGKRTVAQVLADPTSRKVLASRAKRTYCSCSAESGSFYKKMNSKA